LHTYSLYLQLKDQPPQTALSLEVTGTSGERFNYQ